MECKIGDRVTISNSYSDEGCSGIIVKLLATYSGMKAWIIELEKTKKKVTHYEQYLSRDINWRTEIGT